jgi:hypothetical protein
MKTPEEKWAEAEREWAEILHKWGVAIDSLTNKDTKEGEECLKE